MVLSINSNSDETNILNLKFKMTLNDKNNDCQSSSILLLPILNTRNRQC